MGLIEQIINNKITDKNAIWLMRQAGRYLPEFREIRKENQNFINLCLNEELVPEITLQPLKRFDLDDQKGFYDFISNMAAPRHFVGHLGFLSNLKNTLQFLAVSIHLQQRLNK